MKRLEIIANKSIEEDVIEAVEASVTDGRYTKLLDVHGKGSNGSRFGDNVWPELNFITLVFCSEKEFEILYGKLAVIKEDFPDEGLKLYLSEVSEIL